MVIVHRGAQAPRRAELGTQRPYRTWYGFCTSRPGHGVRGVAEPVVVRRRHVRPVRAQEVAPASGIGAGTGRGRRRTVLVPDDEVAQDPEGCVRLVRGAALCHCDPDFTVRVQRQRAVGEPVLRVPHLHLGIGLPRAGVDAHDSGVRLRVLRLFLWSAAWRRPREPEPLVLPRRTH